MGVLRQIGRFQGRNRCSGLSEDVGVKILSRFCFCNLLHVFFLCFIFNVLQTFLIGILLIGARFSTNFASENYYAGYSPGK